MTANGILTAARVRETLNYDQDTGIFTRRLRTAQRHQVGDRADFLISSGNAAGYSRVTVDGKRYQAHRVAWLHVYGEWPADLIDHINGEKSDNRIANLRNAGKILNGQNQRKARADNSHGFMGVHWHAQASQWRARLCIQGKFIHLGLLDTPELASEAYLTAKRKHHEGCTI